MFKGVGVGGCAGGAFIHALYANILTLYHVLFLRTANWQTTLMVLMTQVFIWLIEVSYNMKQLPAMCTQGSCSADSSFFSRLTFSYFFAERLNNVEPQPMVNSKSIKVPRERLLRPWFHSPLSRFQSSLMFRKTWEIHRTFQEEKSVKYVLSVAHCKDL